MRRINDHKVISGSIDIVAAEVTQLLNDGWEMLSSSIHVGDWTPADDGSASAEIYMTAYLVIREISEMQ